MERKESKGKGGRRKEPRREDPADPLKQNRFPRPTGQSPEAPTPSNHQQHTETPGQRSRKPANLHVANLQRHDGTFFFFFCFNPESQSDSRNKAQGEHLEAQTPISSSNFKRQIRILHGGETSEERIRTTGRQPETRTLRARGKHLDPRRLNLPHRKKEARRFTSPF